jgi:hypothetical protein
MKAQGNALGQERQTPGKPCKGETRCVALSGLTISQVIHTQGVALGWHVWPFQGRVISDG